MVRRLFQLALLAGILALLCSCSSSGSLAFERETSFADGRLQKERVRLSTPRGPNHPGGIEIGPNGVVSASTGSAPSYTPASKSLGRLPYLGGFLLVAGVLVFVARLKLPFLPAELGIGLGLSGLLLMVLPAMIEAYLSYILLGLVGTAAVVTIYRLNRTSMRLRQLDPADPAEDPSSTSDP